MYDDFFFPYEKAKLWTGNMFLLSLSNFCFMHHYT